MVRSFVSSCRRVVARTVSRYRPPLVVETSRRLHPHRGKALICYIVTPFLNRDTRHLHGNQPRVLMMARLLEEEGYEVSVVSCKTGYPIKYGQYDVILGQGEAYESSFDAGVGPIRIWYATSPTPATVRLHEMVRLRALLKRKGRLLSPRRSAEFVRARTVALSDWVICAGTAWSTGTIEVYNPNVCRVPVNHIGSWHPEQLSKDFARCRRSFLWFGAQFAVHKGLDLVLDAMELLDDDVTLHVCAQVAHEGDFMEIYRERLLNSKNIKFYGFVDNRGEEMRRILNECAFVVSAPCPEGGVGALVTCMYSGMVPVAIVNHTVALESGVIAIDQETPQGVASAMRRAMTLDVAEVERRARTSHEYAQTNHSLEAVEVGLRNALHRALIGSIGGAGNRQQ